MLIVAKRAGNALIVLEMTAWRTNNCKDNHHLITLLESKQFRHLYTLCVGVYICHAGRLAIGFKLLIYIFLGGITQVNTL